MKILFLFLLSTIAFSQKINQLDSQGKKDGLWQGFYPDSQRLRYEGQFKNGIEQGTFKFFDDTKSNDLVASRVFSENGTIAFNKFFDQNKNLVSEGKTINRKNEGEWRYYHKNSKVLKMSETYKNGLLNGKKYIYYDSGTLAEESFYIDGKRNGSHKIFTEKGIALEDINYKNNEFDGVCIFRNALGQIISQGMYVNGEKKGKWQFFENGKLTKTETFPKQRKFLKKNERQ